MLRLEDLPRGNAVRGILPNDTVTVVDVQWHGTAAVELIFKDSGGRPETRILFRADAARLEIAAEGQPWRFDADGRLLRLAYQREPAFDAVSVNYDWAKLWNQGKLPEAELE